MTLRAQLLPSVQVPIRMRLLNDCGNAWKITGKSKGISSCRRNKILRKKIKIPSTSFRYGESNPELPRAFNVVRMKGGNVSRYTIPDLYCLQSFIYQVITT